MKKNQVIDLGLTGYDELFMNDQERADIRKPKVEEIPLIPLHDMAELRGTFEEITSDDFRPEVKSDDYVKIILTDEQEIPDAKRKLDTKYKQIMHTSYDNSRTRANNEIDETQEAKKENPMVYISALYEAQNGLPLDEEQRKFCEDLLRDITEG